MSLSHKEAKEFETFWRQHEEETTMRDAPTVMLAGIAIILLEILRQGGGVDKPTKEEAAEEKAAEDALKVEEAPPPPPPAPVPQPTKIEAHRIEKKK